METRPEKDIEAIADAIEEIPSPRAIRVVEKGIAPGEERRKHVTLQDALFRDIHSDPAVWGAHSNEELVFELLHRYNILSLRARLLRLLKMELTEEGTVEQVNQELDRYSTAIRNYRSYRDQDSRLFARDETFDGLISFDGLVANMVALDELRNQLGDEGSKSIDHLRTAIDKGFVEAIHTATSSLTAGRIAEAKKALVSRLLMALGGGFALIGPMLVMILHPTKLTTILTTSCCVVATAVLLAVFMRNSEPKDVLGCTAAYAAVLVVFVGAGGGSS